MTRNRKGFEGCFTNLPQTENLTSLIAALSLGEFPSRTEHSLKCRPLYPLALASIGLVVGAGEPPSGSMVTAKALHSVPAGTSGFSGIIMAMP